MAPVNLRFEPHCVPRLRRQYPRLDAPAAFCHEPSLSIMIVSAFSSTMKGAAILARTGRLFELLQILRSKKQPVTALSLSQEMGVSERTLYRDLAELTAQGAPIFGEAGVGYVLREGMFLPPLMFSNEETEAVVLGLKYVNQFGDEVLKAAARDAAAKIASVLSVAARETLQEPISLPGPVGPAFPENLVDYAVLRSSIDKRLKLRIAYRDAQGAESNRIVWPIALGFMQEARVVVAWCETRQAFRTFRTDRISAAEPLQERYPERRNALLRRWRSQIDDDAARQFADGGDDSH
ncbi:YafY family protein [Sphingomonas aerolata]|uniref:helix-turn-helix transcriptional regulator n=1 Tax=Sphingomonas aerolata TaxID=185951 RepID=UPI002FE16326